MGALSSPGPASGRDPRPARAVSRHSTPRIAFLGVSWLRSLFASVADREIAGQHSRPRRRCLTPVS